MKFLDSTIMRDGKPIKKGYDTALAFAYENKPAMEAFIKQRDDNVKAVDATLVKARSRTALAFPVVVAIVGLLLLLGGYWGWTVGLVVAAGFITMSMESARKKKIAGLESAKEQAMAKIPPQFVTHLGRLSYVVHIVPFEDGKIVLDATGTKPKEAISYPVIPDGETRLKELGESLSRVPEELPILLPAAGQTDLQSRPRLMGVEAEIEETICLANKIFSDSIDVRSEIPVFQADNDIVRGIQQFAPHFKQGNVAMHLGRDDRALGKAVKSLARTSTEDAQVSKLGAKSLEDLMSGTVQRMDRYLTLAKRARDHSLVNVLGDELDRLGAIYEYPLTRFYCPKCHQVQRYRIATQPVPAERLLDVSADKLGAFYRGEQMLELRRQADAIRRYLDQARRTGEDLHQEHFAVLLTKLKVYDDRIRELAADVADIDTKPEIRRKNAVLKYNTAKKMWTCQLCGDSFSDEQAQWARMLKVKDDLLLPTWDHLWLEKHDERNTIIREREAELRVNKEKEVTQLREEAKVFTEEYRAVRNQLEEAAAHLMTSTQQLEMMLEFFAARGILSRETVDEMRKYFSGSTGRIPVAGEIVEMADQLEAQLEGEPEAALVRRAQMVDYADEVRNTEKYFVPVTEAKPLVE